MGAVLASSDAYSWAKVTGGAFARGGTDDDVAAGAREPLGVMVGDLMPLNAAAAADTLVCDKLLEGGRGRVPVADGRCEPHLRLCCRH